MPSSKRTYKDMEKFKEYRRKGRKRKQKLFKFAAGAQDFASLHNQNSYREKDGINKIC